ncbi:MAG: orotidine-5'-phosphate decarboxylase [Microbacteriaceae bacterium]|nr:orotidine-5'-phosphate decarboxylase [Microbacteriaceae bacterium]
MSFANRLTGAFGAHGQLCVGIDPHEHLLGQWGLDASAAGVREFGLRVVDACAGSVGIVKPQVSFFERHGSAGFAALEDVMAAARAAGLLVIADAKRGDIGTTMDAYARAWLTPGSPLEADALTVSPYLGVGSLRDTFQLAHQHGKGIFVLAATSNPEGAALQRAVPAGAPTVARAVADEVSAWNLATTGEGLGSIGLVVGATIDRRAAGLPEALTPPAPILAPGFGAQGARLTELATLFGADSPQVIASESRGVLGAGPDGMTRAIGEKKKELGVIGG